MQLTGVIYPSVVGNHASLQALYDIQASGQAALWGDGNGYLHGEWFIDDITETQSEFLQTGEAQRIEFDISLRRKTADDQPLAMRTQTTNTNTNPESIT